MDSSNATMYNLIENRGNCNYHGMIFEYINLQRLQNRNDIYILSNFYVSVFCPYKI